MGSILNVLTFQLHESAIFVGRTMRFFSGIHHSLQKVCNLYHLIQKVFQAVL